MTIPGFDYAHNWKPHYWRNYKSALTGYRECANCRRCEWYDGRVEPSTTHTEVECEQDVVAGKLARRPVPYQDCLPEMDCYGW